MSLRVRLIATDPVRRHGLSAVLAEAGRSSCRVVGGLDVAFRSGASIRDRGSIWASSLMGELLIKSVIKKKAGAIGAGLAFLWRLHGEACASNEQTAWRKRQITGQAAGGRDQARSTIW